MFTSSEGVHPLRLRLLGVHNTETRDHRLSCALIDGRLALDAGALTRSLSLEEQLGVEAILLSHRHFDHSRDLATIGMNTRGATSTPVAALGSVHDELTASLLNGVIWSRLFDRPEGAPSLVAVVLTPYEPTEVAGYHVVPVPTPHSVPSCGFLVRRDGAAVFFSGDTGEGLAKNLIEAAGSRPPTLIVTEVTYPNGDAEKAASQGHLTPAGLGRELDALRAAWGTLPRVLAIHRDPRSEAAIVADLAALDLDPAVIAPPHGSEWTV